MKQLGWSSAESAGLWVLGDEEVVKVPRPGQDHLEKWKEGDERAKN